MWVRRLALVAAWVLATAVVTFGAWQFVDAASSQVNDQPLIPLAAPDSTPATHPTTSLATTTSTSIPGTTAGSAPTTTDPIAVSTTTGQAVTSTTRPPVTSTTRPAPTTSTTAGTTSTTATAAWKQQSVPSPGGTVRVSYRGDEVRFETAQPAPGFETDVEKAGPDEVRVEFDGDGADYEVRARSVGGVLQTSVTESGGDDD